MKALLIHPPVSKPCEPPPGIARLWGALHRLGVTATIWDANLEGLLNLIDFCPPPLDTWTYRAARNRLFHLQSIKSLPFYGQFSRYKRAVLDLNRLLQACGSTQRMILSLANFQHPILSPVRSVDLIQAAERPESNPFYSYFETKLRQVVGETNPRLVGISLNYLSQAIPTFGMIGFLKKNFSNLPLVMGGGLVTSWLRRPGWGNPFKGLVDSFVAGPGEIPLLALLGLHPPSMGLSGLPDYGCFPLDHYLSPGFILPYSASSGCYWNRCLFCPERAEGNPYLPVPSGQVIQDLRSLITKKKPVLIHFLDNAISPALLEVFAGEPIGVPWYGFVRFTDLLADLYFCESLKRSGCVLLQLGLESGDQGVLDQMQKGVNLSIAARALRNLKKVGISTYVYLLFGTPAETERKARKTLEFAVQHSDEIGFLNLAVFNLPAYGEEARRLSTQEFYEGDLSLYSEFAHPQGWNRNRVRAFLDKEFRRHPAIAPILRRDPPFFASNHAPFFVERRMS